MLDHSKWSICEIQTHVRTSSFIYLGVRTTQKKKKNYNNMEAEDKRTNFDLNALCT